MTTSNPPDESNAALEDLKSRVKIVEDMIKAGGGPQIDQRFNKLEKKVETLIKQTMERIDHLEARINEAEDGIVAGAMAAEDMLD